MELFELAPEKLEIKLSIKRNGKPFHVTHELRAPEEKDWLDYDKHLAVAMEDAPEGEGVRYIDDSLAAMARLWDALCQSVQGYSANGEPLPQNFKTLVAPEHKRAAILTLMMVAPETEHLGGESLFLSSDTESIAIRASREQEFRGLVHRFSSPSPAQRIEYSRLMADSYVIRGRKSGKDKIMFPSRLVGFIRLYDALIDSVTRYSVREVPIAKKEDAVRYMDAQHKRVALQELMKSDQVEIDTPEELAE